MIDYEKLLWIVCGLRPCDIGTMEEVEHYLLQSPEGQRAVRDFVRKKWCSGKPGNYPWRDIEIGIDTVGFTLTLDRHWWSGEHTDDQCFYVGSATEAEAFAEAVIWFAERAEKEGE